MATAQQVIQVAIQEIGYHEKASNSQLDDKTANSGSNNFTKYARDLDSIGDFYNGPKQGLAFCDIFNDWCHWIANGRDVDKTLHELNQPRKSAGAGCKYSYGYYKKIGRVGKEPRIGAQIFYGSSESTISHTGIVENFDNQFIYTIEGNVSNSVKRLKTPRNSPKIYGYGYPLYDIEPTSPSNTSVTSYTPSNKEIALGSMDALKKEVQATGQVYNCDSLNVRTLPGAGNPQLKSVPSIPNGTIVEILDKVNAANDKAWYYIRIGGKVYGFVSASYIQLVNTSGVVANTSSVSKAIYEDGSATYSTR